MYSFPLTPQMTPSPRVPSSASPAPTTAATGSESDSASPQWNGSGHLFENSSLEYDPFMNASPYIPNCVDPYLNSTASYNNTQSDSPAPFNGEAYFQQSQTLPTNSLLLSTGVPYGSGSQMNLSSYYLDNHNDHSNSVNQRTSPIPHIRIDTRFTSPSLTTGNISTPNHCSDTLSAYSTSPPSGHKSPYTPPSISSPGNTLIVDPARQSPHSPTTFSLHRFGGSTLPHTPKSPYPSQTFTPSPTSSSISGFGEMNLVGDVGFPRGTQMPSCPVQPVQSVYEIARMFPGHHQMVPQRTYRPNTQSDRRRYVEEVQLEQPIMFFVTSPDGLGISCRDALNSRFIRLRDRDDQMFINRGPSVSIRVQWPGYPAWSRQIPTRDFRTPPGPITRAKLAKNVAKTVDRFITEMSQKPMEEDADPRWRVGNHHIRVDQLELVGLQHVSMGSWQVHLRYRAPV